MMWCCCSHPHAHARAHAHTLSALWVCMSSFLALPPPPACLRATPPPTTPFHKSTYSPPSPLYLYLSPPVYSLCLHLPPPPSTGALSCVSTADIGGIHYMGSLLYLWIGAPLYAALALYLDKVLPSKYGVRSPACFCCTPKANAVGDRSAPLALSPSPAGHGGVPQSTEAVMTGALRCAL